MAATIIDSGRRVFTNLKSILFTPYTDESTLGETTYDLVNIVGDTTSVEQADNDVQTIEHEFSSSPLYESVTLGDKTWTTKTFIARLRCSLTQPKTSSFFPS